MPSATNLQDPSASRLKLSAAVKYEEMALKLYQPISHYELSLTRMNAQGEKERFQATLATRMAHYEDYLAERKSEIVGLQKEWETVMGEIWKVGVSCLGEETMKDLLLPAHASQESPSYVSKATGTDPSLFVPERGSSPSPPQKLIATSKRVSFDALDAGDNADITPALSFPSFLRGPSRYQNQGPPTVPPVPEREIKRFETTIETLGQKQADEFRSIEKDHRDFWKKKNARLTHALRDD